MSIAAFIEPHGVKELLKNIIGIQQRTPRALRKGMYAALTPVKKTARQLVRKRYRILEQHINIKVQGYQGNTVYVGLVGSTGGGEVGGDGKEHFARRYMHLIEFGHGGPRSAPPYPFLRPAYDVNKAGIETALGSEIFQEITGKNA